MITFRITVDIQDDRRIVLTLPPEVPIGQTKLEISIATEREGNKPPRTSLAEWAEQNAENWGDRLSSEDVSSFTGRRF